MSGRPKPGTLAAGAGVAVMLLAVAVAPMACHPAPSGAPSPGITANGVTLASVSVELPGDTAGFPGGPNAERVTANCTACHSASMVLSQPALSPDQWKAEVTKMREIYRAPVADADVPAILTYLNALTAARGEPATARAQDPAPRARPHIG